MEQLIESLENAHEKLKDRQRRIGSAETFLVLIFFLHSKQEKYTLKDIKDYFETHSFEGFSGTLKRHTISCYVDSLANNKDSSDELEILSWKFVNSKSYKYMLNEENFIKEYITQNESRYKSFKEFIQYLRSIGSKRIGELQKSNHYHRFNRITFYTYLIRRFEEFEQESNNDSDYMNDLKLTLLIKLYDSVKYDYGFLRPSLKDINEIKKREAKNIKRDIKKSNIVNEEEKIIKKMIKVLKKR